MGNSSTWPRPSSCSIKHRMTSWCQSLFRYNWRLPGNICKENFYTLNHHTVFSQHHTWQTNTSDRKYFHSPMPTSRLLVRIQASCIPTPPNRRQNYGKSAAKVSMNSLSLIGKFFCYSWTRNQELTIPSFILTILNMTGWRQRLLWEAQISLNISLMFTCCALTCWLRSLQCLCCATSQWCIHCTR